MKELYTKIDNCCKAEIAMRNHQLIRNAKSLMPDIIEFTNIVFNRSNFDMDDETYKNLRMEYMDIIEDLMNGMDNQDEVLVMDSLYDGLLEFINLFLD